MSERCLVFSTHPVLDIHAQNGTKNVLHIRDIKGDSMSAITAGTGSLSIPRIDTFFVEYVTNGSSSVQALIVPELAIEAPMVASLGYKAKVPILSFSSLQSASPHNYYLQIKEDETAQFDAIIALLEKINWRNIVVIYEETDDGLNSLKDILDKFEGKTDHVVYKSFDPLIVDDGMIIDGLVKLKSMTTSIFIVHASQNLANKVFLNARRLSMMNAGYAWLVSSKTMNFVDSLDRSALDLMQGALGLKLHIPDSHELQNFTLRWKREGQYADIDIESTEFKVFGVIDIESTEFKVFGVIDIESTEFKVFGVRAYDTIWAVSKAAAKLKKVVGSADSKVSQGSEILTHLLKSDFKGLGGDYQFINGSLRLKGYELVNVVREQGNVVGYWTPANGLSKELSSPNDSPNPSITFNLKTVIWPGLSRDIPKSWLFHENGRKLQIAYPVKVGFKELVSAPEDLQKSEEVNGFVMEVFKVANDFLGYDVPYDLVPYKNVNGGIQMTYDEIVESVYHKRYDAAVGDISITANRSLYVDFTLPYTELGLGTIDKLDKHNKWFFLTPLDSDLWIAGSCFLLLLGVVVWIIEHPINEEFQGSTIQQIGTILWFSVCTLVYAHKERLRSNLSRFVVGIWLFVVFILTASYIAILSSTLTVQQIQATAGDTIGYQFGSSVQGNVENNFNFTATDDSLQPFLTAKEYADALSKTKEEGGVGAIIDEMSYIRIFLAQYPSDYGLIETTYTSHGFGFFFQKGSHLVPELSRAIEHLQEIGKLHELEQKWYNGGKRESLLTQKDNQAGPKTLSLSDFRGLFLINVISKVIVLILLLFIFLRKKISMHLSEVLLKMQMAVTKKYL